MINTSDIAIAVKRTPHEALSAAISKLPIPVKIPDNTDRIIVKPSIYNPKIVGNTSLPMTQAAVRLFKEVSPIFIVESDNPIRSTEEAFSELNYDTLEGPGVELFDLSTDKQVTVKMPGNYFSQHEMPTILTQSPFIVNAATLKIEANISGIGAGIKNLFGLLPEKMKSIYHERIDDVLMDLLILYTPNLTIIDLTELIIGGRLENNTRHFGGVIVGTDPVAVDSYCAKLMGIDPLTIPHIHKAHELGLGEALPERINVHGTEHQKALFDKIIN
ncbi:MAG: DUF362 domain-containing protein [Candidatus Thorarchaeota archaeon]